MPNILDDEFMVSTYLNKDREPKASEIIDNSRAIEKAIQWSTDANRVLIIPTGDLDDIEDQWNKFNQMPKKSRRISDWKSLELFGCTNQDTYENCRSAALANDIDAIDIDSFEDDDHGIPLSESAVDLYYADTYYHPEVVNYTPEDVDKAREWADEANRAIIIPTRTLEELEGLWDAYNTMIKKHRRESDWMSLELFGLTNLKHYEHLKSEFLKQDIPVPDSYGYVVESADAFLKRYLESVKSTAITAGRVMLESVRKYKNMYEETITNNVLSDILDKCDSELICNTSDGICCGDMPYYDPDTMIDMGVFSSNPEDNYFDAISDNILLDDRMSVHEWFELYKYANQGFYTEFHNYSGIWANKVRRLMFELARLKESGNEKAIKARKQAILELGWNPDVEFSNKNRAIVTESARDRINSLSAPTKVIDLTKHYSNVPISSIKEAVQAGGNLRPVYVVLVEGKSYMSSAIRLATKDIYSHAAISLTTDLKEMYSYGININSTSDRAGFRKESIDDLPPGGRIRLYAFFVSNEVYKKIEGFIGTFKNNAEKTSYSYMNLITYLFNIPYNKDWSLICSQFVDKCLKAGGINIIKKDSSVVSPHDLNVALKEERRIYTLYEGSATKYDALKIDALVSALITKAKPIKESKVTYIDEGRYISDILSHMGNVPVLLEMHNHIDVVKNDMTKRILESLIFDRIDIKEYTPVSKQNSYTSMAYIEKAITKNMTSV